MIISKEYTHSGGKRDKKINAFKYTKDGKENSVYTYIASFKEKYNNKLIIENDELKYTESMSDVEKKWVSTLNLNAYKGILPNEYQLVDYIYCNGNQYIYVPLNNKTFDNIGVSYKVKITERSNEWGPVIISTEPNGLIRTFLRIGEPSFRYMYFEINAVGQQVDVSYYGDNNKSGINVITDVKLNTDGNRKLFINNKYVCDFANKQDGVKNVNTFCIFAAYYEMDISKFIGYFYDKLVIYNNGIPQIELYPCYNKETKVVGLYDTIGKKFYTNQGSGNFIKGNDI